MMDNETTKENTTMMDNETTKEINALKAEITTLKGAIESLKETMQQVAYRCGSDVGKITHAVETLQLNKMGWQTTPTEETLPRVLHDNIDAACTQRSVNGCIGWMEDSGIVHIAHAGGSETVEISNIKLLELAGFIKVCRAKKEST